MQNVDPTAAQVLPVYKLTHEALPPLESGQDDAPAAAILSGSEVQNQHYEAAYTQHQYRKALSTLGRATADEVMDSQKRKTMVLVDGKLPLPAGEDFAQHVLNRMDDFKNQMQENIEALKTQVEDVKAQMEGLKTQVEDVKTQMEGLKTQVEDVKTQTEGLKTQVDGFKTQMGALLTPIAIQTAKNANRSLVHGCEALVQVPNNQGDLPVNLVFPQTIDNLMNMEGNDVNRLLTFYGILPNVRGHNLHQRKGLLCRHLGLVYNRN